MSSCRKPYKGRECAPQLGNRIAGPRKAPKWDPHHSEWADPGRAQDAYLVRLCSGVLTFGSGSSSSYSRPKTKTELARMGLDSDFRGICT